jgi:hypothetical protein
MPLSPTEVEFINKAFDKHLATWRGWTFLRYFLLLFGIHMIVLAYLVSTEIPRVKEAFDLGFVDNHPHILNGPAATRPVTRAEFLHFMESGPGVAETYGSSAAMAENIYLGGSITAAALAVAGIFQIGYVLSRWNHHRRDAILIKLLREKCRDELTLPTLSAGPSSAMVYQKITSHHKWVFQMEQNASTGIPSGKHVTTKSKLTGSSFRDVCLGQASFEDVNLGGAVFHDVNLAGARFDDVNMAGVEITNANVVGMKIHGVLVTELLAQFRRNGPT